MNKYFYLIIFITFGLSACNDSSESAFYDSGSYLSTCFQSGENESVRGRVIFTDQTLSVFSLTYNNSNCENPIVSEISAGSFDFEVKTRGNIKYLESPDPQDPSTNQVILFVEQPDIIYTWTLPSLPQEDDPNLEAFFQDPESFIEIEVDNGGTLVRE